MMEPRTVCPISMRPLQTPLRHVPLACCALPGAEVRLDALLRHALRYHV